MKDVFNFNITYAGAILIDEKEFPCNLYFFNSKIIFKVITNNFRDYVMGKFDFEGYVSTELGIMNFKGLGGMQIHKSTGWSEYAYEEYQVDTLVVTTAKNNLHLEKFGQVNILYHSLESIGRFVDVNRNESNSNKYAFKLRFEEIEFYKSTAEHLILRNSLRYFFSNSSKNIFSAVLEPFFDFAPVKPISYQDLGPFVKALGWFMQLLFGSKQYATDLILFEFPVSLIAQNTAIPYYFFNQELIFRKNNPEQVFAHPIFSVEHLQIEIKRSFKIWKSFNKEQAKICALFFNEINSKNYIRDDRFKNLCSVIQGLEVFETLLSEIPETVKGSMNCKLRRAFDDNLEQLFSEITDIEFLYQLFVKVGIQRDHYQHLNKPLKYDLNDSAEDINAVNLVLQTIIKYHILKAIGFVETKIAKLINRDLYLMQDQLMALQLKINNRKQ